MRKGTAPCVGEGVAFEAHHLNVSWHRTITILSSPLQITRWVSVAFGPTTQPPAPSQWGGDANLMPPHSARSSPRNSGDGRLSCRASMPPHVPPQQRQRRSHLEIPLTDALTSTASLPPSAPGSSGTQQQGLVPPSPPGGVPSKDVRRVEGRPDSSGSEAVYDEAVGGRSESFPQQLRLATSRRETEQSGSDAYGCQHTPVSAAAARAVRQRCAVLGSWSGLRWALLFDNYMHCSSTLFTHSNIFHTLCLWQLIYGRASDSPSERVHASAGASQPAKTAGYSTAVQVIKHGCFILPLGVA